MVELPVSHVLLQLALSMQSSLCPSMSSLNSLLPPYSNIINTQYNMDFQDAPLVFFRSANCGDLDRIVQLEVKANKITF